jgi:hypothetical protein
LQLVVCAIGQEATLSTLTVLFPDDDVDTATGTIDLGIGVFVPEYTRQIVAIVCVARLGATGQREDPEHRNRDDLAHVPRSCCIGQDQLRAAGEGERERLPGGAGGPSSPWANPLAN